MHAGGDVCRSESLGCSSRRDLRAIHERNNVATAGMINSCARIIFCEEIFFFLLFSYNEFAAEQEGSAKIHYMRTCASALSFVC